MLRNKGQVPHKAEPVVDLFIASARISKSKLIPFTVRRFGVVKGTAA